MDNPKTEKEKTLLTMPNTPITLATLQHEQAALKELLMTEVASIKAGIKISHDDFVRFPTEVDKRVGNLDRIMEIKIAHRSEIVGLHVQHFEDKLDWAKELVNVNGANTTKQIDALALLVSTLGNGLNDKITDIKDRVTVIEGRGSGMGTLWGILIAAAIVLIGVLNYLKK